MKISVPNPSAAKNCTDSCFNCCSGASLLQRREAAGLRLTEASHPPGLVVRAHAHERTHFCLLLQGVYEEHWGTRVVIRNSGSLALTPGGAVHSNRIRSTGIRFFTIELPKSWIEQGNGYLKLAEFVQF